MEETYFDLIPIELLATIQIYLKRRKHIELWVKFLNVSEERLYWAHFYSQLFIDSKDVGLLLFRKPLKKNYFQQYLYLLMSKDLLREVIRGRLDSIIYLVVYKKVDINIQDERKSGTPLMKATYYNYFDIIKFLLEYGADPNIQNNEGYTALMFYIAHSFVANVEIINLLIKYGADPLLENRDNSNSLIFAAMFGHIDIIEYFLNIGYLVDHPASNGMTMLMGASQGNDLNTVKYLLRRGANINHKDNYGNDALFHAISNKNIEIIDYLKSYLENKY